MIGFGVKQIGFSSDINDPLLLKPMSIALGEWWSLAVPKSALPSCNLKLAVVQNIGSAIDDSCGCELELNKIIKKSCLYKIPNDDTAYLSLTILDKDIIPAFNILVEEIEILEFEGGTIDDLVLLINGMNLGVDELGYGVRIYFDKKYNGSTAVIQGIEEAVKEVYLLNDRFCLNYSKYIGISFSFCETGCHRLVFINNDGCIVAFANQFNVVKKAPKNERIIEYYLNGFYYRHRLFLDLKTAIYLNEEEQKTLSNGDISIINVIIRTQREFYTGLLSHKQHLELLSIFKKEFKIDGEKTLMVGSYSNDSEGFGRRTIGNGNLNFKEQVYKNINACSLGCESGSIFRYEIYETEKIQTILQ
jgi:hypothetical protein